MRLLIAEDDKRLLQSLVYIFKKEKYIVDAVSNGSDALAYAQTGEYDGLVFDIMMPGLDGITVLQKLRKQGITTPTLFLTAKAEVEQKVEGLDTGADDYLAKPFSTQELLARVRAILRRKEHYVAAVLSVGNLELNCATCELSSGENSVTLSGKEYQIMEMLMQNPTFILTAERIMSHIWGWEHDAEISVLWVHISNLRKKLVLLDCSVEIRFIRNAGYILCEADSLLK